MISPHENIPEEFSARCEEARAALRKHMAERELREQDGWRIFEFIREVDGRTELVMRPVHSRLPDPPDLECACIIDEGGSSTSAECRG